MAYTTPDAVRLVLTADGNQEDYSTAASLDDTTLTPICTQASDQVDAYLGARYSVPFTTPAPSMVADLATDIAAYLATLTFRKGQPVEGTDPVWLRYQRAQKMLRDLASGTAVVAGLPAPSSTPGQVAVANPTQGPLWSPSDYDLVMEPTGDQLGLQRWWGGGGWGP